MSEDTTNNADTGETEADDDELTQEERDAKKAEQQARRDARHPHGEPPGQQKKTGGSEPAGEA